MPSAPSAISSASPSSSLARPPGVAWVCHAGSPMWVKNAWMPAEMSNPAARIRCSAQQAEKP